MDGMNVNVNVVLGIVLVALVLFAWYYRRYSLKCEMPKELCENFGQDPSIRASAGWAAGRGMYGYDPVDEFAQQIEEQRLEGEARRIREGRRVRFAEEKVEFGSGGDLPPYTYAPDPQ